MRLTLRTLLAYLDNCLEAGDAQELGRKIEDSQFASDLTERIRRVITNPRLGALRVSGQGPSSDANAMAEYLDSTLPPERAPNFEKKCLESDMWLAEVASCHQILTLVLGKPAEIPPSLRERAYRIGAPNRVLSDPPAPPVAPPVEPPAAEEEAPPPAAVGAASPAAAAAPAASFEEPPLPAEAPAGQVSKVPEYLRDEGRPAVWPLAATVLAGFLLAAVVLRLLGPFDRNHPILGMFVGGPTEVAQGPESPEAGVPDDASTSPATTPERPRSSEPAPPAERPARPVAADQAATATADAAAVAAPDRSAEPTPVADADVAAPTPDEAETPAQAPPRRQPPVGYESEDADEPSETAPPRTTAAAPTRPMPDEEPADAGDAPRVAAAPPAATTPAETVPAEAAPADATPAETVPAEAAPAAPAAKVDVARFTSEQHLMARWDEGAMDWFRLAANAPLSAGQTVVSLPAYRPQVLLDPGLQMTLAWPSRLHFDAPAEDGVPRLIVDHGRATVITPGRRDARLHLDLGGIEGIAVFANPDAHLALEVESLIPLGADPAVSPRQHVARLIALQGVMRWIAADGAEETISAGQALTLIGGQAGHLAALEGTPAWVDGSHLNDVERRAARELELEIGRDRGLSLVLREYANHRRSEYRTWAVRSLVYLNQFDAILEALRDQQQKSSWPLFFDTLREAIARDPETAEDVRLAMVRALGNEQGQSLYRLTWGYSPDDLRTGGQAKRLVDLLESQDVRLRVFALENLRRITGKTMTYRPEYSPERSRAPIQAWKRALAEGEIHYEAPAAAPAAEEGAAARPAPTPRAGRRVAAEPPPPEAP